MDAREIRKEFFKSIKRVDRPRYVEEEVLYDTEQQGRKRFERKVFTHVVGASDRHILLRSK